MVDVAVGELYVFVFGAEGKCGRTTNNYLQCCVCDIVAVSVGDDSFFIRTFAVDSGRSVSSVVDRNDVVSRNTTL